VSDYPRNFKKYCIEDGCRKEFFGKNNQLYCSAKCRKNFSQIKSDYPSINGATVGAIQEYKVTIDLLSKGYEVFRSTSPNCSCDLLIILKGTCRRIEVTTAYKHRNGKLLYNKKLSNKFDILALALPKGEIKYIPEF